MNARTLAALAAGAVFGVGLAVSGMTDPRRILGFLDVAGEVDLRLLFVLGGAVLTSTVLFHRVLRRSRPLLAPHFALPSRSTVDRRLVAGAAVFGVGWGLAGYCPGPALVGLGIGAPEALWFVPAMLAGIAVQRWQSRR
jgi:uncharacterized membrane protein YedE/YeeE